MEFIGSLADWEGDNTPSAVTIGMFDGIHLGHQALIRDLVARAGSQRTVVLTFDRHPRLALSGQPSEGSLTTLDEKKELLAALGVDLTVLIPVESGLLKAEAEVFVRDYLVRKLHVSVMVIGYDFRFGRDRRGDFELLRLMSSQYGYNVCQSPVVLVHGFPVKSTRVRECLKEGNPGGAAELLGRRYSIGGEVVRGDGMGRELGYPTANVAPPAEKLLPASGVYAGVAWVGEDPWPAAINLGTRPTVSSSGKRVLEAHLPGFSGDLYGQRLIVEPGVRLRGEERFAGLEALQHQIHRDVEETERWYWEHGGQMVEQRSVSRRAGQEPARKD